MIGEKKELDLINKIDLVLDKVKLVNREIRDFQKKHEEPLPDKISATSEKTYELTSKEKYRSRIKYAATFILELVRKKRYQYLSSKSAEAKAIERIKNTEETEWIVVSEPGKTINIDQINERLKKRGYNVQISHKNSSAG